MGDIEPEELAVRRLVRDEGGAAVDVVEEIVEVERPAHDLGRVPAKVRVLAERRRGIMPEQHRDALRRFEEGRVAGQLDLDAALMLAREEGAGRIDPVEVEHVQRIRGVQRLDIAFHMSSHPVVWAIKGARHGSAAYPPCRCPRRVSRRRRRLPGRYAASARYRFPTARR